MNNGARVLIGWVVGLCSSVALAQSDALTLADELLASREPVVWNAITNPQAVIGLFLENQRTARKAHGKNSLQMADATMLVGHASGGFFQKRKIYDRALRITRDHVGEEHALYGRYLLETSSELLRYGKGRNQGDYLARADAFFSARAQAFPYEFAQVALLQGAYAETQRETAAALNYYLIAAQRAQVPGMDEDVGFKMASTSLMLGVLHADEIGSPDADVEHCRALARLFLRRGESGPKQIHLVNPDYPSKLILDGNEGVVTFSFDVNTTGRVRNVKIEQVQGDKIFGELLMTVIERWRFAPRIVNDEFVTTRLRNVYRFVRESGATTDDIIDATPFN
ncbi:MAG: energy transducer TonB [Gammaproteobacteria bacterium]